ncbi:MAG: hypothetical protein LBC87_04210 [Fibromonadaceae bacterium]|jgi:hypothetical protein|nr:hypothetical protein [Fibromonadaceae bacterium]
MGKKGVIAKLSPIEKKAFDAVKSALSKYVKPKRLKPIRNEQDNYFSIKLDGKDGLEVCFIRLNEDGSLKDIGFPRFIYKVSSSDEILSHKDKLLYKLIDMASRNNIIIP